MTFKRRLVQITAMILAVAVTLPGFVWSSSACGSEPAAGKTSCCCCANKQAATEAPADSASAAATPLVKSCCAARLAKATPAADDTAATPSCCAGKHQVRKTCCCSKRDEAPPAPQPVRTPARELTLALDGIPGEYCVAAVATPQSAEFEPSFDTGMGPTRQVLYCNWRN